MIISGFVAYGSSVALLVMGHWIIALLVCILFGEIGAFFVVRSECRYDDFVSKVHVFLAAPFLFPIVFVYILTPQWIHRLKRKIWHKISETWRNPAEEIQPYIPYLNTEKKTHNWMQEGF